jgi:asparagine synthase (glutamine-hydrolysing)
MCGIAGVVGPSVPEDELLRRMAERMSHRGPDSQETWHDERAGFAFRRLAIIDLDHRSDQPLHLGSWHLVFNGEIYNYRELRDELRDLGHAFETEGDGEVLLHAWAEWEEAALDRLNGMFAFAIWHDVRKELVCARDPFGEKPLFWANGPTGFAFASEIRALLVACPTSRSPRENAVPSFLGLGLMPPIDQSFLAGIQQLPAAHLLRVREGRVEVHQYWQPRRIEVPADRAEAAATLRELLADSIRLRLRSDVPVGTSLSGGIDSSAIVCLASKIAGDHRRHAFTARFRGFERDEWSYAEAVAREAGVTEHHSVEPAAPEFLDDLPGVICSQEEPFGSASIYAQWRVMKSAREAGITVLLDGQGADELFGGYHGSNGWALRSQGLAGVGRGLASTRDRGAVIRALGAGRLPARISKLYWHRLVTPYAGKTIGDAAAQVVWPTVAADGFQTPMSQELLRQTFHTSLPALLRHADRNSMAHSREVRLPFLDRRVAEYALSLPAAFLYRDGATKAILRDAVAGIVPAEVLERRDKVGYEPPQASWFGEPRFVSLVSDVLLDRQSRTRGWYSSQAIEADAATGRWRDLNGIWRALNLELWMQALQT